MSTVKIAVVSDLHCGSTVAVCPPSLHLDDGGTYQASRHQLWLWQLWKDFWERVERERDEEDAELYVVYNGDLVDGDHHDTPQIMSRNPVAQAMVLTDVLDVPEGLGADKIFVVRGTGSHVGKSGSSEEKVAMGMRDKGLPLQGDPERDTASWWHLRMDVQGLRLSFTHHGRTGYRPWTRPNASNLLAMQIFTEHALNGERHPDIAIRSHYHRYMESARGGCPTYVLQTPAWQLATAYVHKVAPESLADIGGVIITIRDGQYSTEPVITTPSRGAVWTAST